MTICATHVTLILDSLQQLTTRKEPLMTPLLTVRIFTYLTIPLAIYCAIFMGKALERNKADLGTLILLGAFSTLALIQWVRYTWQTLPNGKPRPENELKRGVVYYVNNAVFGVEIVIEAGLADQKQFDGNYWKFESPALDAIGLRPGNYFVYLDDPGQYLMKWKDANVVMILSDRARKKTLSTIATDTRQLLNHS